MCIESFSSNQSNSRTLVATRRHATAWDAIPRPDVPREELDGRVFSIEPQSDQITVHTQYTSKFLRFGPVDGIRIAEPFILEHLLSLEKHGYSRAGKCYGCSQCGPFLRMPTIWVCCIDFGGNPSIAIGYFIMRF